VDEELEFHLAMREEELGREGWSPEDARGEALRQFGSLRDVRDQCRRIGMRREGEMRIADVIDGFRQDLAFTVRQFMRSPSTSLLSLLTLALGIGATTVVFSVVNAVVLRPLPFENPHEIVRIEEVTPQGEGFSTSDPNYLDWRERQRSFTDIAAMTLGDVTLTGDGDAQQLSGLRVTYTFFPVLAMNPELGRNFLPDEDVPGGDNQVAILSSGFWTRRFGADPEILDRTIQLDGRPFQVVGVAPTDEAWPGVDVFTPLAPDATAQRNNHTIAAVGRLAPGVSFADARTDMVRIAAELAGEYPEANEGWSADLMTAEEWRIGDRLTRLGLFLMGAVTLLLLMACGSVSNILVARATTRQREIGLRAALGAGRARIMGQLVTESAVLAILGGGLGVLLAWWATPLVRSLGPDDVARLAEARVDGQVLAVAALVSVLSVLVFGLVPALYATRGKLSDALREGASAISGSGRRLRDGLVVGQFTLAVIVLLGAGLMLRSFARLQTVDLGFAHEEILRFSLNLPPTRYSDAERVAFVHRLQQAIVALPGAEAAGINMNSPYGDFRASNFVAAAENVPDRQDGFVPVSWRSVTGEFFAASGVPLHTGRTFDGRDRPPEAMPGEGEPALEIPVIVDRNLAERLWPDGGAVGKAGVWEQPGGMPFRVIGVVGSMRDEYVDGPPRPRVYLPYDYFPWAEPTVLVRASTDPATLAPAVRNILREMDPDLPLIAVSPLDDVLRTVVAWPRFSLQVLGVFAVIALILSGMGIYGVTAFGVTRRQREIGVRVALGADPGRVLGMVLRQSLRLAVLGIIAGIVVAIGLSGFLGALLYDTAPRDPLTYGLVPLFLGATALLSAWIPARRATKVDPRSALTAE
jgi:predicted permease